eukprot:7843312-Heterocapsa_arctica.AAC.1
MELLEQMFCDFSGRFVAFQPNLVPGHLRQQLFPRLSPGGGISVRLTSLVLPVRVRPLLVGVGLAVICAQRLQWLHGVALVHLL